MTSLKSAHGKLCGTTLNFSAKDNLRTSRRRTFVRSFIGSAIWCRKNIILLNIFSACLCSLSCHSCSRSGSVSARVEIFFLRSAGKTPTDVILSAKRKRQLFVLRSFLVLREVFYGKNSYSEVERERECWNGKSTQALICFPFFYSSTSSWLSRTLHKSLILMGVNIIWFKFKRYWDEIHKQFKETTSITQSF